VFAIVIPAATTYASVAQRAAITNAFRAEVGAMGRELSGNDAVIAKWPTDRIAQYYLDAAPAKPEWMDYDQLKGLTGTTAQEAGWVRFNAAVAAKRRLWLIDTPAAGDYLKKQGYTVAPFQSFVFLAQPPR
jgi:hypothetical protein